MSIEIKLRTRYTDPGRSKKTRGNYNGNSGKPVRGTPPVGLRKRHKPGAKRYN